MKEMIKENLKVEELIQYLLDNVPEDYSRLLFNNEYEYILNELKLQKRGLNKMIKDKNNKYSNSFLQMQINIFEKAIKEVKLKIK